MNEKLIKKYLGIKPISSDELLFTEIDVLRILEMKDKEVNTELLKLRKDVKELTMFLGGPRAGKRGLRTRGGGAGNNNGEVAPG